MFGQTKQTLANIEALLRQAGSSPDGVLKATVYLTDMGGFAEMNRAYAEFFRNGFPARSCLGVSTLPDPEALVEIDVIALRGTQPAENGKERDS
jgi:2-iminobutanoate/2-iminopropanoate deaminase